MDIKEHNISVVASYVCVICVSVPAVRLSFPPNSQTLFAGNALRLDGKKFKSI